MRPIPRSRHLVAVVLLAAVAAATGYLAAADFRLGDGQVHAACTALKRHDRSLFAHDPVFGRSSLWRFHSPAFQGLLETVLLPAGYDDPVVAFRALAGVAAMVYLCGMYALLYRQTRTWSVAVFVAALSATVTHAMGGSFWGAGSLGSIHPAGLCTAVTPLIALAFLRHLDRRRLVVVFGFVGLLGNLHPASSLNLGIVLLIVYLARRRLEPSSWPLALACIAAALAAAAPYLWYCGWLARALTPAGATVDVDSVYEAVRLAGWEVLYPGILRGALNWPLFLFLLVVPGTVGLHRAERYAVRDAGVWAWWIAATLFVAFGLQGASQAVGVLRRTVPPVLTFVQASALIMLPLYVLLAHGIVTLLRLTRRYRNLVRWACAALTATWVIPSHNFRVARYAALEAATSFMDADSKPRKVLKHREKLRRHRELVALGRWARTTDPDAVFLCDDIEFRLRARRAIVASADDLPYFYYFAPWRLDDWAKTLRRQGPLLFAPDRPDLDELRGFVSELSGRPRLQRVTHWYAVLPARPPPATLGDIPPAFSGRFYQAYRLPGFGARPTTSAADHDAHR
jgi:hypothetical protein